MTSNHRGGTVRKHSEEFLSSIPHQLAGGKTLAEIAEDAGTSVGSLRSMCSKRRIPLKRAPQHSVHSIRVSGEAAHKLRERAQDYGIKQSELLARLVEVVCKDDLFDAVLKR